MTGFSTFWSTFVTIPSGFFLRLDDYGTITSNRNPSDVAVGETIASLDPEKERDRPRLMMALRYMRMRYKWTEVIHWCRQQPAWPDVGINRSPIFSKVVWPVWLENRAVFLEIAQKFGILYENLHPSPFKNSPIWFHWPQRFDRSFCHDWISF